MKKAAFLLVATLALMMPNCLKAQHPEFETFLLGKHGKMLSCADCHMETITRADGSTYKSHELVSPLESKTLGSSSHVQF